jgi:hypothetical protein
VERASISSNRLRARRQGRACTQPTSTQRIGGTIFVTYAKRDDEAEDDVHGGGLGFVDAYDTAGTLQGQSRSTAS